MQPHRLSILAVCLTFGCAHGKSAESTDTSVRGEASQHAQAADHNSHQISEADKHADAKAQPEHVEVPNRRTRGEMASTSDTLPAPKRSKDEPPSAQEFGTEPDNTRVNERDRENGALTPMDQGSADADIDITQRIRKDVVGDDSLSFTAKNVKIITRDGQVTLRGTVNSKQERTTIEQTARRVAGPGRVTNELEVSNR